MSGAKRQAIVLLAMMCAAVLATGCSGFGNKQRRGIAPVGLRAGGENRAGNSE